MITLNNPANFIVALDVDVKDTQGFLDDPKGK